MISFFKHVIALGAVASLAGCATDRTFGASPSIEVTALQDLPPPTTDLFYRIGPQETLDILVVGAEPLSGRFLTDERGDLSYPLLGIVNVGGLHPSSASQMIEDGLRGKFLRDPQVRIIPEEFARPTISVGGQVERPGSFSAVGKPTLLRVVNQAGGLAEYARLDDVLVMRTVEGQRYIGVFNIGAIQRGNYVDPALYPNDIVMVGDSPERRRLDNILQFVPLLTSASIIIDRLGR